MSSVIEAQGAYILNACFLTHMIKKVNTYKVINNKDFIVSALSRAQAGSLSSDGFLAEVQVSSTSLFMIFVQ